VVAAALVHRELAASRACAVGSKSQAFSGGDEADGTLCAA